MRWHASRVRLGANIRFVVRGALAASALPVVIFGSVPAVAASQPAQPTLRVSSTTVAIGQHWQASVTGCAPRESVNVSLLANPLPGGGAGTTDWERPADSHGDLVVDVVLTARVVAPGPHIAVAGCNGPRGNFVRSNEIAVSVLSTGLPFTGAPIPWKPRVETASYLIGLGLLLRRTRRHQARRSSAETRI